MHVLTLQRVDDVRSGESERLQAIGVEPYAHRVVAGTDIVGGEVELNMRNVGHLICRDNAIDDRGPVDSEGLGDCTV